MITRRSFISTVAAVAVSGGALGLYNKSASAIVLEQTTVPITELPDEFDNFKIGILSDFHSSNFNGAPLFDRAVDLVMSQKPDLITLLGDYISSAMPWHVSNTTKFDDGYVNILARSLSRLSARHGVVGVMGNHDYGSGKLALEAITKTFGNGPGVEWLKNSNRKIVKGSSSITLLGVDDYWSHTFSLPRAIKGASQNGTKIMLSHNPDINAIITPQMGIDLVLSGHTHGGQIKLPVLGSPLVPSAFGQKYLGGFVKDGSRVTYVTRGVGSVILPARFNCPPEATILTLTRA